MTDQLEERLAELDVLAAGSTVLDALRVAVAVEDSFGVVLRDADIAPECLCSPRALRATIRRYLAVK